MHFETYVKIVKRMKDVQSIYKVSYSFIVIIAMMPILTSIVIVLTKYGAASLVNEIKQIAGEFEHVRELKNHPESAEFEELSIIWSFASSVALSICGCKYSVTY